MYDDLKDYASNYDLYVFGVLAKIRPDDIEETATKFLEDCKASSVNFDMASRMFNTNHSQIAEVKEKVEAPEYRVHLNLVRAVRVKHDASKENHFLKAVRDL